MPTFPTRGALLFTLCASSLGALPACSSEGTGDGGDSGSSDAAPSDGGSSADGGGGDAGVAFACTDQLLPRRGADVFTCLQQKRYATWASNAAVRDPQAGSPHEAVRVFVNDALATSLAARGADHPVGSAAVKELYASDRTTLRGWAVSLNWYEIFSTTSPSSPVADGEGVTLCSSCHRGGTDFFLTAYPL